MLTRKAASNSKQFPSNKEEEHYLETALNHDKKYEEEQYQQIYTIAPSYKHSIIPNMR
jgi:uncharacterized iron-regulated protein